MPDFERLISFVIFGLFVFAPAIDSWQSMQPTHWFMLYAVWLALIASCTLPLWEAKDHRTGDRDYDL